MDQREDMTGVESVGRFDRDETRAVAREGRLPYLDDIYRGDSREEPYEAGPHDVVISEQDEFLGEPTSTSGDTFVGDDESDARKVLKAAHAGDQKALLVVDRYCARALANGMAKGDKKMVETYKKLKAQAAKGDKRAARVVKLADQSEIDVDLSTFSGASRPNQPARGKSTMTASNEVAQAAVMIKAAKGGNKRALAIVKGIMANEKANPHTKRLAGALREAHGKLKLSRSSGSDPMSLSGDAFVGANEVAQAGVMIQAAMKGNKRAAGIIRMLMKNPNANADTIRLANALRQAHSKMRMTKASGVDPMSLSGDAFIGDEAKPGSKMMASLARIARDLDSKDEGASGTARSDYQSYVEMARGGDKKAGAYLKIVDELRKKNQPGQAQVSGLGSAIKSTLGFITGKSLYQSGMGGTSSGDDPNAWGSPFDMEDGKDDALDPFFNRPVDPYNDAAMNPADIAEDDASYYPEFVADIEGDAFVGKVADVVGAFCGTGCYRRGL